MERQTDNVPKNQPSIQQEGLKNQRNQQQNLKQQQDQREKKTEDI